MRLKTQFGREIDFFGDDILRVRETCGTTIHTKLTPSQMRRLAAMLTKAADKMDGRQGGT